MKAIINGKIIQKDRVAEGKTLIYDEKIQGIADTAPQGAEIIDAKGNYVAPGLVDIHIHGYLGEDTSDGKIEGVTKMAEGIIQNGVTAFCPTTMTVSMEEIERAFDVVRTLKEKSRDKKNWQGAEVLGVHSEGPFINPSKKGAQAEDHIKKPDAAFVKKHADIIKLITLAPEMDDDFKNIKDIARDTDVVMSIGHTGSTFLQAKAAFDAGVSHVTHLFNAMTPLAHREPGVVGAALTSGVTCELIADTFHVNKGLFPLVAKAKGDKLVLITDCIRAGGFADGESELGGQKVYVKGIECRLEDGTIAGSVLKLNCAVKNFMDNTDLPIYEIVNAASLTPATVVGEDYRKGSLDAGKDADIIIADGDFNIVKTIIGGIVRYDKES